MPTSAWTSVAPLASSGAKARARVIGDTGLPVRGLMIVLQIRSSGIKSLQDLAEMYNPCIRGWINYYSHVYKTQLRPTLKRIDLYVIRWARRKFKRLRRKTKGARDWFDRLRRVNPTLFAHWQLCHGNGRTSGAV